MKRNNLLIILLKENTSVRLGKTNLPPQQLNQLLVFHLEQEARSQVGIFLQLCTLGTPNHAWWNPLNYEVSPLFDLVYVRGQQHKNGRILEDTNTEYLRSCCVVSF